MNGRIAKQIRRSAEQKTIGEPPVAHVYQVHKKTMLDNKGQPVQVERYQLRVKKGCTRSIILRMKKGYRDYKSHTVPSKVTPVGYFCRRNDGSTNMPKVKNLGERERRISDKEWRDEMIQDMGLDDE